MGNTQINPDTSHANIWLARLQYLSTEILLNNTGGEIIFNTRTYLSSALNVITTNAKNYTGQSVLQVIMPGDYVSAGNNIAADEQASLELIELPYNYSSGMTAINTYAFQKKDLSFIIGDAGITIQAVLNSAWVRARNSGLIINNKIFPFIELYD